MCPILWSPRFHFSTESGSHQAKTEEEKFSVQGAKQDCSTLAPFSGRRDQTQAFFFSSCILARRVQWGWPILCWIPGYCGMLTCSARAAAVCAGGGSSPFPVRGRGKTAHVSSTSQDIKCAVVGWKLALGAPFLRHRAAPGSCSPLSEWMG